MGTLSLLMNIIHLTCIESLPSDIPQRAFRDVPKLIITHDFLMFGGSLAKVARRLRYLLTRMESVEELYRVDGQEQCYIYENDEW
jgi:hypothetical protein